MTYNITIPAMGESISEVTIGHILAIDNSIVKMDDELLEIETDKVNQMIYAPKTGFLKLAVKTGDRMLIGANIGTIEIAHIRTSDSIKSVEPSTSSVDSSPNGKKAILQHLHNHNDAPNTPLPLAETRTKMSQIRKVITQRMLEAKHNMAILTTFNEIDMTSIMQLRAKHQAAFIDKHACKLGIISWFVKGCTFALQRFPNLNAYIDGDEIVHRQYYSIGVAIGTARGVVVPILHNCDQNTIPEIEQNIDKYIQRAHQDILTLAELQGGSFTITNGGVYGSLLSTPLLAPSQCGILGVHKIEKRPVVIEDQIVIRDMTYVALSYDHRLIDGQEAIAFLVYLKQMLEDPIRLFLT